MIDKDRTAQIDDSDRIVEEYQGWNHGERVRIVEEDEDRGFFEGDTGTLYISMVGAPEYGNERVCVSFWDYNFEEPGAEIVDFDAIEPID